MKPIEQYYMAKEEVNKAEEQLKEAKKTVYREIEKYIKKANRPVTTEELCKHIGCDPRMISRINLYFIDWRRKTWHPIGEDKIKKQLVELDEEGQPTGKLITKTYITTRWALG